MKAILAFLFPWTWSATCYRMNKKYANDPFIRYLKSPNEENAARWHEHEAKKNV